MKIFKNRQHAGQLLAEEVKQRGYNDPIVLGLPRGGIPVAAEVAAKIEAPLDVVLVRKIGAPMQPELAIGAVVDDDTRRSCATRNSSEISGFRSARRHNGSSRSSRNAASCGQPDAPSVHLKDKTAIIVDDGIATGATVRASLHALKRQGPKTTVVATPVAPLDTIEAYGLKRMR